MATRITVALEDDLDGGPAEETVRFAVGGTEYEIDLNKKNAGRSASSWHPSSSTPAGLAGGSAVGKRVARQAVSTAAISARGRKNKASPSAAAGASLPAFWSSTKPPPKGADPSLDHGPAQTNPHQMTPGCAPIQS